MCSRASRLFSHSWDLQFATSALKLVLFRRRILGRLESEQRSTNIQSMRRMAVSSEKGPGCRWGEALGHRQTGQGFELEAASALFRTVRPRSTPANPNHDAREFVENRAIRRKAQGIWYRRSGTAFKKWELRTTGRKSDLSAPGWSWGPAQRLETKIEHCLSTGVNHNIVFPCRGRGTAGCANVIKANANVLESKRPLGIRAHGDRCRAVGTFQDYFYACRGSAIALKNNAS
jgi:hypothetical protein